MTSPLHPVRFVAGGAAALAAVLCFAVSALLSPAPALPPTAAPSAGEVRAGRDAAVALASVASANGAPRSIRFTPSDLAAIAALADHGLDDLRVRATVAEDLFRVEASLSPIAGAWIDLLAEAAPNAAGFPDVRIRAGRIELPAPAVRLLLTAVEWWARARGLKMPPLDSLVHYFQVGPSGISATLSAPASLRQTISELLGPPESRLDPSLLREICARLMATPGPSFAGRLRAAFAALPPGVAAIEGNRAAFVALAMVAVDPRAGHLAGDAAKGIPCSPGPQRLLLAGRDDLPKHFALSAAMGAMIPSYVTRAMGEWKELDDSLPGGSGFSFVDLTADRAGMHLARAAVADEASAGLIARRLAVVEDSDLLPPAVRKLSEGMDEASFRRRYGSLNAQAYARAVREIDALLAAMPLYAGIVQPG